MRPSRIAVAGTLLGALLVQVLVAASQQEDLPPPATHQIDFVRDVQPIFEKSCTRCHARGKTRGGFSIETREKLLAGGDSGPAVLEGRSGESLLIELVAGIDPDEVMPQKGSRLTPEQVGILRAWIDQGLPWPPDVTFERREPRNLTVRRPELPPAPSPAADHPIDRLLAPYLEREGVTLGKPVDDRRFARRVFFDIIGLPPTPRELAAFETDPRPDKRERLVARLLADRKRYAEHWLTFWNDLLRNDYRGPGYIDGGRSQITRWLYTALVENLPYDQFVAQLIAPVEGSEGFTKGIVWRGAVNASQQPPMQAAQNIAQVFMGVNLKCASCHDSFINDWQLADAYGLAGVYADGPLEMVECDRPTGKTAQVKFIYDGLGQIDANADRRARIEQLARIVTGPQNGRLSRTIVNRLWARLMGRGLVEPVDDMEQPAWHPDLLDWLAEDLVEHGYDLKHTIARIVTSQAYQAETVDEPETAEGYVFRGPLVRRLGAEQFIDAVSAVTGIWQREPEGDFDFRSVATIPPPPLQAHRLRLPSASVSDKGERYLRASFDLSQVPFSAHALVVYGRRVTLYVNGHEVAPRSRGTPQMFDLTPHLVKGRNVLAARIAVAPPAPASNAGTGTPVDGSQISAPARAAGEGPWIQVITRRSARSTRFGVPLVPDARWRVAASAAPGWEKRSFADGGWRMARFEPVSKEDRSRLTEALERGAATAALYRRTRASLVAADPLATALGRPNREQVITVRASAATTLQALELSNGSTLATMLADGARALLREALAGKQALLNRIYRRALGRLPTAAEKAIAYDLFGPSVEAAEVEDLLWALVMLPEFQLIR